jgi:hypothetical protein
MENNTAALLRAFWKERHGEEEGASMLAGVHTVNLFRPKTAHSTDLAKFVTVGYSVLWVLQKAIEGPIPDNVIEAVAQSLTGMYGLGKRRGKGTVYFKAGKVRQMRRYIDPITHETLPSKQRMAELDHSSTPNHEKT